MQIKIFLICLSLLSLAGCGDDNDSPTTILQNEEPPERQEPEDTDNTDNTDNTSEPAWTKLSAKWSWMPDYQSEDSCASESFTLKRSGSYIVNRCGEKFQGKLTDVQLADINARISGILTFKNENYECSPEGTQDYYWTYKITSGGKTKKFFHNDGLQECYRGNSQADFEPFDRAVYGLLPYPEEEAD